MENTGILDHTHSASDQAPAQLQGLIFDLDGVIVDTAHFHFLAWQRLGADLGVEIGPEENESLKGLSRKDSLQVILDLGNVEMEESEKERQAARKNEWYKEYITSLNPGDILPGVMDFIHACRAEGLKLGIGSSSKNAKTILKYIGLSDFFDAVADGTDISKGKPDPEIFLTAASRLGLEPHACMVLEDAESGVEAAHRAGMKCIGYGTPAKLQKADLLLDSFNGFGPAEARELFKK